jgi:hypothetical protein
MEMLIQILLIALTAQTTQPADDTLDWLLTEAATAPTTRPANDEPPAPVLENPAVDAQWRHAVITLSNGEQLRGRVATTYGKPIRIFDIKRQEFRDIAWELIESMEAEVVWERIEREWKFRESGSDIREYSGRTYPARELQYTLTLKNGRTVTGGVVAPLYMEKLGVEGTITLVLHKRQKGEIGEGLEKLVYVKRVVFTPPASQPATQPAGE